MAWVAADETVEIQISATAVGAPSYGTTLKDVDNELGFSELTDLLPTRVFVDARGFRQGLPAAIDTKMFEAFDVSFSVYADDTSKVLIGKESQYLYLRYKAREGNSDKITIAVSSKIASAQIARDSNGIIVVNVTTRVFGVQTTVA